ncbi:MAG: sigma 54-interacting transcriptional regulator [Deltaproteobacteria bacterium]|nr:sigma 54-interacting transcriptional regulator [Deltaproteobacteria bacterium]
MVSPTKPLLEGSRRSLSALVELHEALAPGSGVIVVGGPRGVGKALLLGELRRELAGRGRLVLFGRAEQAATHPYASLREPAAQALAFLEARGVAEDFLETHARAVSVLLPQLSGFTRSSSHGAPRARDKAAFFEALRAFFAALAHLQPLTLILSDLHAADDDTRDAVRFLAQHLFNPEPGAEPVEGFAGVLVCGTRTDEDPTQALARALAGERRGRMLEVGGLSRDQLLDYLRQHPLLDRLLASSRGRPEDLDELLESLPRDTDALLLQRVQALELTARRALHALAVLGRPSAPDLVAGVIGAPVAEVAHALGQLVELRILARRLQNGELLFGFARPHHQEVLAHHLADNERAALHHAVATALEARGHDAADPQLAFHFLLGNQPERGVRPALTACERLLLTFAYGTAVDLATRALPGATPAERFELLGHLVEAQRLRGELRAALAAAEEMLALADDKKRPHVLRRMGELLAARGDHRAALDALEEALGALAAFPDESEALPERALVLAAMAEVAYAQGDLESAQQFADDALGAAPQAPMAFHLRVANTLAKVAFSRERFDDAEARFLSNLRLAEEHGLDHEAVLARMNAGLAKHRRGHADEARDMLERALSSARAIGDLHNEAFALLNLGTIYQRTDETGRALDSYRAALVRFSRLGNRAEVRRVTWNLANLSCAIGDYAGAYNFLEQSRHLSESDDSDRGRAFVHFTEGDIAFNQGQPAVALACYEKARTLFLRIGEASRVAEMTAKSAWAALLLGDVAHADRRIAELPPPPAGTLPAARKDVVEGALHALASDGEGATRGLAQIARGVDELERLRALDDAWRALAFLADRYDVKGDARSGDAARARARGLIERAGERLSTAQRELMRRDPARAALLGRPVEAAVTVTPAESTVERAAGAPAPSQRKPEWDARYPELIGRAPALLRVLDRLDRIARTKSPTVLVRGESGTGKELVAAAIHRLSERASGPFVRVNCAALVETLLMSELFGHEKGSFTGALARKIGRFELARGGTIFLDEIGDISPKTQVSLLRVLQERQFERVGGTQTIHTDAVVICATHRDLESMVREGSFREDLYYRLRGVVVEVPALRERPGDIPVLAQRFLQKVRDEVGRAPLALAAEAEAALTRYRWPGNIRELQNMIRSVALFCEGDVVEINHLGEFPELFQERAAGAPAREVVHEAPRPPPPTASAPQPARPYFAAPHPPEPTQPPAPAPAPSTPGASAFSHARESLHGDGEGLALGDLKRRLEFEAIANAMRQTGGNITRAAQLLKMKRPRLSQIVNGNPELKAIKDASRDGNEAEAD